jgi:hypothetical protein
VDDSRDPQERLVNARGEGACHVSREINSACVQPARCRRRPKRGSIRSSISHFASSGTRLLSHCNSQKQPSDSPADRSSRASDQPRCEHSSSIAPSMLKIKAARHICLPSACGVRGASLRLRRHRTCMACRPIACRSARVSAAALAWPPLDASVASTCLW